MSSSWYGIFPRLAGEGSEFGPKLCVTVQPSQNWQMIAADGMSHEGADKAHHFLC